jgi:hypothetical protein
VTINATTVTDGTTYTAANGEIITVNKPPGSPYATSITTTVNGQTVTLPLTNPTTPTVVNGERHLVTVAVSGYRDRSSMGILLHKCFV